MVKFSSTEQSLVKMAPIFMVISRLTLFRGTSLVVIFILLFGFTSNNALPSVSNTVPPEIFINCCKMSQTIFPLKNVILFRSKELSNDTLKI